MTITIDERLAQLAQESAALDISRTRAQQEADALDTRIEVLAHRTNAIRVAATTLAGLTPLAPEQEWLDHLTVWRKTLCDELLALPPRIYDSHTLGVQQNLTISIRTIDFGLGVITNTGYDLTTLRLGQLMREAGYEAARADSDPHHSGVMPWFGSLPETERRIAMLQKRRADAEAALADAMLDDDARAKHDAESKARTEELNARPVRKTRGDGSQYDKYPDGRRVEVTS